MTFKKKVSKFISKEKEMYKSFQKVPTLGENINKKAIKIGKKVNKFARKPKIKKIKKGLNKVSSNINYYLSN